MASPLIINIPHVNELVALPESLVHARFSYYKNLYESQGHRAYNLLARLYSGELHRRARQEHKFAIIEFNWETQPKTSAIALARAGFLVTNYAAFWPAQQVPQNYHSIAQAFS